MRTLFGMEGHPGEVQTSKPRLLAAAVAKSISSPEGSPIVICWQMALSI